MVGIIESEWGIIIIVAVVVLVFGGSQLPKLARSLGSAQSEFKKGLAEGKGDSPKPTDSKATDSKATATDSKATGTDSKATATDGDGPSATSG